MKYFTPERYLRLGTLDDRAAFLAAHEQWEKAIRGYQRHLRHIRADLPAGLRRLVETVYLHDARILDMWWNGRTRFSITLQPETDAARLVVLAYSLVEPPTVRPDVLPIALRSEAVSWLYDELAVAGNGTAKERVFAHSILLSDGRELRLNFRNVRVTRPVPLMPQRERAANTAI